MAVLIQAITKKDATIAVSEVDINMFPKDGGMVQIASELISYEYAYMGKLEKCIRGCNHTAAEAHLAQDVVTNVTGTTNKAKSKVRNITVYLASDVTKEQIKAYKDSLKQLHYYSRDWDEVKGIQNKTVALTLFVKVAQLTDVLNALEQIIVGATIVVGDSVEPACVIVNPLPLASVSGVITLQTVLTEKKASRIDYKIGDTVIGSSTIFPYDVQYDVTGTPVGNLDITAYAYNSKGKELGTSVPLTLIIPGTAEFTGENIDALLADGWALNNSGTTNTVVAGAQVIEFTDTGIWDFYKFDVLLPAPAVVSAELKMTIEDPADDFIFGFYPWTDAMAPCMYFNADGTITVTNAYIHPNVLVEIGTFDAASHIYKITINALLNTEFYIDNILVYTLDYVAPDAGTANFIELICTSSIGSIVSIDYMKWIN